MVRSGATISFDLLHSPGGRTGAVASKSLSTRDTVFRVNAPQLFTLESVAPVVSEASARFGCDPHVVLALGLAEEKWKPSSAFAKWIDLLPATFANVLWFNSLQLELVRSTFFAYIADHWFRDLKCLQAVAESLSSSRTFEDLRWALSIVKTRSFASEGRTMLIPLADHFNHHTEPNVRIVAFADSLRFIATQHIMPGEELFVDTQASNLEYIIRYGYKVEDNPFGGRQFDLQGEPLQSQCPSCMLRYDWDVIENFTIDCHRHARYVSFEQQFGQLQMHEQVREDNYIYSAVEDACTQLLSMLVAPNPLSRYEMEGQLDLITQVLVKEIRAERVLLQRCIYDFRMRQLEPGSRPVPKNLVEAFDGLGSAH